ncbi:hypothetical protein B0H63DRAFT_421694, partial [Podospora didyma]
MGELAMALKALGREKEAKAMLADCFEAQQRVLGPDHAHSLISMANLAGMLRDLGQDEECLEIMEECAAAMERVSGLDDPRTCNVWAVLKQWRIDDKK